MQRIIIYGIVLGIFIIIINLLKYDDNFKGLSYDSSLTDVISYVTCSLSGCGYVGVQPISKIGKIIIILLSVFKYLMFIEILIKVSIKEEHLDIFRGIEQVLKLEGNSQ